MWNRNMKPTPLTFESLEISRHRRLEIKQRGKTSPTNRIHKIDESNHPDPCLKSGSYLPVYRRLFFTPELVNVPLEDLDPFYADAETFVIVTEKKLLYRFSAKNSLNIFSPFNPVRRTCISVLQHWIYRCFIIMTAVVDCCLLTQLNIDRQLRVFYIFGTIYTFDFVTNVIARGVIFDRFTFLRDGWGIVDLLLLVPYYIPFIGRHHFLCGLRSLKIAAFIPSLKTMVKAVLKTVGDLRDMFLWTMFSTWIFALVGYHFYMGISIQKCVLDFPEDGFVGKNRDLNWHDWVSNSSNWYDVGGDYYKCGNGSWTQTCRENFTCLQMYHPADKLYSTMGWALLSTIQIMLQDFWFGNYIEILDLGGLWHALYVVVTLFLGSFYTLNMILAVVSKSYDDLQKKLKLDEKPESGTTNISCSNTGDIELNEIHERNESNHINNNNEGLNLLLKRLDLCCKNPINNIWKWFINLINVIAFHPFTELIMATATATNFIFLSMDHFGLEEENPQLHMILVSGYQIVGIMFAVECLLKIVACGPIAFLKDKWNKFDALQTSLFLFEYKFEVNTRWMKALLSLRSLRIFQLARIWSPLDSMLNGVLTAMGTVSDMTVVAIGVFYMFCVAGIHLFGGKIETSHPESHWHFRDFWHSFMVIFRLLCGEWAESMFQCFDDHGWICVPFFISAVIVLDLVVLNLLLVMFLQRFSLRNSSTNCKSGISERNKFTTALSRFKRFGMWMNAKFGICLGQKASKNIQPVSQPMQEELNVQVETSIPKETCVCPKLRIKLQSIMNSKYFKYFNITNTVIASICLPLLNEHFNNDLQDVFNYANHVALSFMIAEAAIKIVAMEFYVYIKNKWKLLDFIIVLAGIFNVIITLFNNPTITFFRSMRVFRLFSNFEGMRIIFNSLGRAMSKIFGILLVCLVIWLLCAIVGVQLLKGRFHSCSNLWEKGKYINKTECLHFNFTWRNKKLTFDDVGSAYMRVLEIITFKGWTDIFDLASSSGETSEERSFENSFWISGYFVGVVLFGSFFAFNLFTGVLIDGLNEEKAKIKGNANTYGSESAAYNDARKYMQDKLKRKLSSADTNARNYQIIIWEVVTSKHFAIVILLNLVFNMVLLNIEQQSTNVPYEDTLTILNGISTAIFGMECLLNMFAHTSMFFRNPRSMFELFTELLSIFDILWRETSMKTSMFPSRPGLLRLVRFAWVSKYLRHFKAADGLRRLLSVLQISLVAFSKICFLLVLVVFIYGLLGMELFMKEALTSFLFVLFPMITSANWALLLDSLSRNKSGSLVHEAMAGIYVFSYLFITFVILVNMFSAVILESYSRALKLAECELGDEHFEMVYEVLSQFDTQNSQFVDCKNLADLFERFEPPLQVAKPNQCATSLMNISIYQGNLVHSADVLDAAITYLYFRKGVIPAEIFCQDQNKKGCEEEVISSTFQQQRELRSAKIIQRAWRNKILNE